MMQRLMKLAISGMVFVALSGGIASRALAIDAEINGEVIISASETVNHDITVSGSLIISEGVTLTFQENGGQSQYKIVVNPGGNLILNGTAAKRVVLTTDGPTALSGWKGIENYGTVTAHYTDIKYAAYGISNTLNGSCSIEHSVLEKCGIAVRVVSSIKKFSASFSSFTGNGHAFMLQSATAPETDVSQIYGNQFSSNTHNFYLGGDNNISIWGNDFQTIDGNHIFELGRSGDQPEKAFNEHVYIYNNNFYFTRSLVNLDEYFIVNVTNGTPIGIYNCYWKYNTQVCDTVAAIQNAKLVTPTEYVAIYNPLSTPVTVGSDTTAPELVELSPGECGKGTIYLTVVIRDEGWGVDPASVQIKVGNYQATINSYTVNTRQYIFEAVVTIGTIGEYVWSVSAKDLAGNAMTNQTLGAKLVVVESAVSEVTPPVIWENNSVGAYQLITLPIDPYEKDHKIALGLLAPGSTVARWQYGKYVYYGDTALEQFEAGKGFWVKWGTGESYAANPIRGELKTDRFKVPLTPGWHLIGDPFDTQADAVMMFDRLTFHYGDGGHTFSEAVTDGVVGFGLWGYNGTSYQLERESLKAWQGYWVYVKLACELQYWTTKPPMPIPNTSIAWNSNLPLASVVTWEGRLTVSQTGSGDSANYFGFARSATAGVDNYDVVKPPMVQSPLQSYFLPQGAQKEYGADYRPDTGNQAWDYVVKGLQPGEAQISWNNLSRVPAGTRLLLKDGKTGQEIDMASSNAYSFRIAGETERRFEIRMQNQLGQALQITNPRLSRNPFAPWRETLVITYDLSANATMELKIYDWVGNLVYIHPAFAETSGVSRQVGWDGRNNLGRRVANGVYFCRLSAREGNSQTVQTLKVAVVN